MNILKNLGLLILLTLVSLATHAADKVDPNHTATGGYGYLLTQNQQQALWWAEGAYKVMKDAPLPQTPSKGIYLESARNEWESFILVSRPVHDLTNLNITLSDLKSKTACIPASAFTVRKVEYVPVTHPTDQYAYAGLWPDPLPLFKKGETLKSGENHPFWISIKTPEDATAGNYQGTVTLSGDGWSEEFPLTLNVWDFTLPHTPTMRSGFGLDFNNIATYNNLQTDAQKRKVFDLYMKAFADYKISPYNPFEMAPIKETITGVDWQGGFFDSQVKHSGKYSLMVADHSYNENIEASLRHLHPVKGQEAYDLRWWAKAEKDNQPFVVGVECYDKAGQLLWFENRVEEFRVGTDWSSFTLPLGEFAPEIAQIMIRLYPTKRTSIGEGLGTVWFDDMELNLSASKEGAKAWVQGDDGIKQAAQKTNDEQAQVNLLPCGNFEVDLTNIDIQLDFTDFEQAARLYFGEYGFNSFRLSLKGLGGGTYYSSNGGIFEGFAQGTEEYNILMKRYLMQMQEGLEEAGVLGKEYIYWFDEPGDDNYPFIHETHAMIKQFAPKLTTFLTEHLAGHDISDVTDISCTIWHQLNHQKIKEMGAKGMSNWSYLCCWPKSPWISEFIDHDAVNFRMWNWASYVHQLSGILMWSTTYWNSVEATPTGKLQNPWTEAMSWVTGYGWVNGKQTVWGNGDGRYFYPENRDVNNDHHVYDHEAVPCVRLELLRDGIEDYEYLVMLERLAAQAPKGKAAKARKLLKIPETIYKDEKTYNKNPQVLLEYRRKLAKAILSLQ